MNEFVQAGEVLQYIKKIPQLNASRETDNSVCINTTAMLWQSKWKLN